MRENTHHSLCEWAESTSSAPLPDNTLVSLHKIPNVCNREQNWNWQACKEKNLQRGSHVPSHWDTWVTAVGDVWTRFTLLDDIPWASVICRYVEWCFMQRKVISCCYNRWHEEIKDGQILSACLIEIHLLCWCWEFDSALFPVKPVVKMGYCVAL